VTEYQFICNLEEKDNIEKINRLAIGERIKWCEECFRTFKNFKHLMFIKHSILMEQDSDSPYFAIVAGTKYTNIDKEDEERIRSLPPVLFDTNDLGW